MTTHATWNVIWALSGDGPGSGFGALACGRDFAGGNFDHFAATRMLRGEPGAPLPDCPTCASFIDAALSIRAEAEQEKVNAELDAEREAR